MTSMEELLPPPNKLIVNSLRVTLVFEVSVTWKSRVNVPPLAALKFAVNVTPANPPTFCEVINCSQDWLSAKQAVAINTKADTHAINRTFFTCFPSNWQSPLVARTNTQFH